MERQFAIITVLDAMGIGAAVFAKTGEILQTTVHLESLLERIAPGCCVTEFTRAFQDRICNSGDEGDAKCYYLRGARRPVAAFCMQMRGTGETRYLLAALVDLQSAAYPSLETLRLAFGLTPAEAGVARKASQGLSCPEVAKQLGVSAGTVRAHMKAVFAKTHTRRQSELVAVLSRSSLLSMMRGQTDIDARKFSTEITRRGGARGDFERNGR
jgi:DNA-binding CsgD family transcriptional regulator